MNRSILEICLEVCGVVTLVLSLDGISEKLEDIFANHDTMTECRIK